MSMHRYGHTKHAFHDVPTIDSTHLIQPIGVRRFERIQHHLSLPLFGEQHDLVAVIGRGPSGQNAHLVSCAGTVWSTEFPRRFADVRDADLPGLRPRVRIWLVGSPPGFGIRLDRGMGQVKGDVETRKGVCECGSRGSRPDDQIDGRHKTQT